MTNIKILHVATTECHSQGFVEQSNTRLFSITNLMHNLFIL